jgi:hypothetical protein
MKATIADTAGPSFVKKPCAPKGRQGPPFGPGGGVPVVSIHAMRAFPPDHC